MGNWPKWLTDVVNWVTNTFNIQTSSGSVKTTDTSVTAKGYSVSRVTDAGLFSSTGIATIGYVTDSVRGQYNEKQNSTGKTAIGAFGKASAFNFETKNSVGTYDTSVTHKSVLDVGVVSANAGIQYKDGIGLSGGAKIAALSAKGTYCFDVFGWQVEVGMDA